MKLPKIFRPENHLLAEDCLVDILLLSRCEFLVHGLSGVSEAAILYSPNLGLHFASLDLSRDVDSQGVARDAPGPGACSPRGRR